MNAKEGTKEMIRQLTEVLIKLQDGDYTVQLPVLGGATLGQHFRHILDFYFSLLRDLPSATIDYGCRERNPRIEQERSFAMASLQQIGDRVEGLEESRPLTVRADFSDDPSVSRPLVTSSVGRELMYAYDHALHHLAIIRIGIQTLRPDLRLGEKIGVAPSTLKFQREG